MRAAALLALTACATTAPVVYRPPDFLARVEGPEVAACRLTVPPVPQPLAVRPEGCPERFAACLDLPGAVALTEYLEASQRWSRDAYARCHQ